MESIQLLSPQVANQIAAGEVVERPSSVVKELVENSVDAGASEIVIEIEHAGKRLIQVRDNGHGIRQKESDLALSRHATSKLKTAAELFSINTLGFRGEALASIASVSQLTLTSCHVAESQAFCVRYEGATLVEGPKPAAHPTGTTIRIANLFFNTPVRAKFLRQDKTEFNHIEEIVKRAALVYLKVGFTLKHNGKVVLKIGTATDEILVRARIQKLCGKGFVDHARQVSVTLENMQMQGWMSDAEFTRSQSDQQYVFLNGRMLRDKLINHALRQAYQEWVPQGRHPIFVLYLTLPSDEVDVNVHPTKHEVRFKHARKVHDFIYQSLAKILCGYDNSVPLQFDLTAAEKLESTSEVDKVLPAQPIQPEVPTNAPNKSTSSTTVSQVSTAPQSKTAEKKSPVSTVVPIPQTLSETRADIQQNTPRQQSIGGREEHVSSVNLDAMPLVGLETAQKNQDAVNLKDAKLIVHCGQGIVLGKVAKQWLVMDLAHLMAAKFTAQLQIAYAQEAIESKPLLIPKTLTLNAKQIKLYQTHSAILEKLGVNLGALSDTQWVLRSWPSQLPPVAIDEVMQKVLSQLARVEDPLLAIIEGLSCVAYHMDLDELNTAQLQTEYNDAFSFFNTAEKTFPAKAYRLYDSAKLKSILLNG